tara:strand:- start:1103 stop:1276 length:174 start_codon:yes stop_codon:yes gene_type:complete
MQAAFCKVNSRMTGARSDIQGGTRLREDINILLVTVEQWLNAKRGSQTRRGVLFVPA